ncbi:MAG: TIM barrel protein [Candidatus Sumerlaeota bacterium]|nr:TIM barrel protein [Candidatus Sumerlaeota bacterium]
MPETQKVLLVPVAAGLKVMERYGLLCECRCHWKDSNLSEFASRIRVAHAPLVMIGNGRNYPINIASSNEPYRNASLKTLESYIRNAHLAPNCQMVVVYPPAQFWNEDAGKPCKIRKVGDYGHMVEGLRYLARVAAKMKLYLVVENYRAIWEDVPAGEEYQHGVHHGQVREYFASSPNEWGRLPAEVNEPNFGLCLDTCHAVTYAQRLPPGAREGFLGLYPAIAGDRLWHLHWNDNIVGNNLGRQDLHLPLGKGTIPRKLHTELNASRSVKTCLFERWKHEGDLSQDIRFVERL